MRRRGRGKKGGKSKGGLLTEGVHPWARCSMGYLRARRQEIAPTARSHPQLRSRTRPYVNSIQLPQVLMSGHTLFRIFKYVLFALLLYNFYVYFGEDMDAYRYLPAGSPIGKVLETFAVTIDFIAWLVLVVLFELETDVLSKERLQGTLKWLFKGTVALCYPVLIYAFYGYVIALVDFQGYQQIPNETVCELVEQNYAYLSLEARYLPLDQAKCAELSALVRNLRNSLVR